jgi:hypothetical protein
MAGNVMKGIKKLKLAIDKCQDGETKISYNYFCIY